jgi:hypothetical protein
MLFRIGCSSHEARRVSTAAGTGVTRANASAATSFQKQADLIRSFFGQFLGTAELNRATGVS